MSDQLLFDRVRYMDKLTKDGSVSEAQARALADALEGALQEAVATETDMSRPENKLELAVRDLKIRVGSTAVVLFGLLTAIKLFTH